MLLGTLHIPKSIWKQWFMQNLGGKQSVLWEFENREYNIPYMYLLITIMTVYKKYSTVFLVLCYVPYMLNAGWPSL